MLVNTPIPIALAEPSGCRLVQMEKSNILITVRDEGVGLHSDFDLATSKRLGTRLVNALSKQLGAGMTRPASIMGTNVTLLVPLQPASAT